MYLSLRLASYSEVVGRELIVPVGLIVGLLHAECVMMDPGVVPLTVLAKDVHLLGDMIGIDHFEVDNRILLEEAGPRCTPIVVRGDGDELLQGDEQFVHTSEP